MTPLPRDQTGLSFQGRPQDWDQRSEAVAYAERIGFAAAAAALGVTSVAIYQWRTRLRLQRGERPGPPVPPPKRKPGRRVSIAAELEEDLRPTGPAPVPEPAPPPAGELVCPTCRGKGRKRGTRGEILPEVCWHCRGDPRVGAFAAMQQALPKYPAPGPDWHPCVVCETRRARIDHTTGEQVPCGGCKAVGWIHESKVPR